MLSLLGSINSEKKLIYEDARWIDGWKGFMDAFKLMLCEDLCNSVKDAGGEGQDSVRRELIGLKAIWRYKQ